MDGIAAAGRRMLRARLRALSLLACALGAAFGLSSVAAASAPNPMFGVNATSVLRLPAEERDRHLDEIAQAGIAQVRADASWMGAEPRSPDPATGEHRYDWSRFDALVATLAAHGLRWY